GVRSLDQAVEIQTEFAKQACETFVAEAQKISEMHRELARQRLERLESLVVVGPQTSRWI
ncbi:MAG TPA: phasin family protein, partial [Bradyrhizobium sp.]